MLRPIYLKTWVLVTGTDDSIQLTITLGEVADVLPPAEHTGEDLASDQGQDQVVEHCHHDACLDLVTTSIGIIITFITHHLGNITTVTTVTLLYCCLKE